MEADEQSIILISNEGDKFEFSAKLLDLSKWINTLPFPFMPISLYDLGIDSQSMYRLKELLNLCEYDIPKCPKSVRNTTDTLEDSPVSQFFSALSDENLLKFAQVSSKIEIKKISNLCCYFIAKKFEDVTKENFTDVFTINSDANYEYLEEWVVKEFPWIQESTDTR